VNTEEHFRQIVVYPRKYITTNTNIYDGADNSDASTKALNYLITKSSPEVINYTIRSPTQKNGDEDSTLFTTVGIDTHGVRIHNAEMEFSRFMPSFPLQIPFSMPFMQSRNWDAINRSSNKQTRRKRHAGIYSLPNLLKELTFDIYEFKNIESFLETKFKGKKIFRNQRAGGDEVIPEAEQSEEIHPLSDDTNEETPASSRELIDRSRQNLGNCEFYI
jgi:hypothetical protein